MKWIVSWVNLNDEAGQYEFDDLGEAIVFADGLADDEDNYHRDVQVVGHQSIGPKEAEA